MTSLTQAVKNFKQHLLDSGRANATILAYCKDVEQLVDFVGQQGKTDPQNITKEDINEFKNDLGKQKYTAKSISRKINSIKSFFRYLQNQNIIDRNPANQVSHPKYEITPPRILSRLEYRALRDTCKDDLRIAAIIELLLQTGMRISEVANLDLEDINAETSIINIKAHDSHQARTVPFNNAVKSALKRYLNDRPQGKSKKIFITKTGNPFLVRNIRSSIDRYFRLAGIENAKVNDLRHTFIAHQITAGAPLTYISQLAGHKRLSTTEKYLEFIKNKKGNESPRLYEL